MSLDIEFWNKSTEKCFKNFSKELKNRSDLTDEEIKDWLEGIYYAVASEFGQ